MSMQHSQLNSNEIEVEVLLKVKRQFMIEKDTTVAEGKRIVKDIFKQFGRDFILMAGENDLTSLDKLGLAKTMDYYKTNVITVIPFNNQNDNKFLDLATSENFKSLVDNSKSQALYGQYCLTTEDYDLKFKENEFYRRSINTACVDLDYLKNHLMSINISREDDNITKASGLLKKTDIIIEETNKFLKNYYNMSKGLSYDQINTNNNKDAQGYTHSNNSEKNINHYNNLKGDIYNYDTYTPNRNIKNMTLPSGDKKKASKIAYTGGYKSTKADSERISIVNDYDPHPNTFSNSHRNSRNNSNKASRENSKNKLEKSPIRNEKNLQLEDHNLNKLKAVVKKTEICLLKEENDYLKETVDVLTKNLNEMQMKINEEHDLMVAKEKEFNELKTNFENLNIKCIESAKENEEFKVYILKLEKSHHSMKTDRKNLLDHISQLQQENAKLSTEKQTLDIIKDDLKKGLDDLNNNNAISLSLLKDNENNKKHIAEMNYKINEQNSEIEKLVNENLSFAEKFNFENFKITEEYENNLKNSKKENLNLKLENSKLKEYLFSIQTKALNVKPNDTQFFSILSDHRFDLRPIINKFKYELEETQKEKEILLIICDNLKFEIESKKYSIKKSDTLHFEFISTMRSNYEIEIEYLLGQKNKLLDEKLAEPINEYNRLSSKFIPKIISTYFSSKTSKRLNHTEQNLLPNKKKSSEIVRPKSEPKSVTNTKIRAIDHKNSNDNYKKLLRIKDYIDDDNSDFIEINADLLNSIELTAIGGHRESVRILDVSEGALFLFRVYDKKSILKFDIENRTFRVAEFADFGNFEENFDPNGSIYLNTLNGLFIVTGKNHDMFYFFNKITNSMVKLSKLNDNHTFGSLVHYQKGNTIICLSGWHNKKVEIYHNDELVSGFINNNTRNLSGNNRINSLKNVWSYLPEMKVERSECPYLIINETLLYSFFGYNCLTHSYVENIEYLNLDSPTNWEELKIKNHNRLSTMIKSHTAISVNKNNILFFGGYDGLNDEPIENFFEMNLEKMEISSIDRKYTDIKKNHFYNFQQDSTMIPFIDHKDRMHFTCFDENDRIHCYDLNTLNYDIYYFD